MKVLIFLATVFLTVNSAPVSDSDLEEWQLFKVEYNKTYDSETEENMRMIIFMDNKQEVAEHNTKYEIGEVTYKLALNQFADMLEEEVTQTFSGLNVSLANENLEIFRGATFIPPVNVKVPDYVNWVEKGAVTSIKDQKQCGSCWAFSAVGAIEGQHFLQTKVLHSLSAQNLIDCSRAEGNHGCRGGLMDNAFKYVAKNGGIDTEKSYPYEAKDGRCRYDPKNSGANITGFRDLPSKNEDALKIAVATIGPISAAVDSRPRSFQLYSGGVYSSPRCKSDRWDLDHGITVVGYGTDKATKKDYWLLKNSWGDKWGEKGYMRLARNLHNQCGIATLASYPLV